MVHEFDRLLPTLVFEEDDDVLACLFEISEIGGFDMKVTELQPAKRVLWQVVDGPEEWIDTKISFDLKQAGEHAIVLFKHQGWKEPVEFMHHCSTKWAIYLMSLKSLVETRKGSPNPKDTHISGDGPD